MEITPGAAATVNGRATLIHPIFTIAVRDSGGEQDYFDGTGNGQSAWA
jgi:hypothetical protein